MPTELQNEIAEKASKAPRVTPADVEAEIASEHYFTAADGFRLHWLTEDHPSHDVRASVYDIAQSVNVRSYSATCANIDAHAGTPPALGLLTICVLVLRNGFTVTGESACASPENFDADIGRKVARQNAINKVWPLLGFRLRDKLASMPSSHIERMRLELEELDGRIARLEAFLKTDTFAGLPIEEANRMRSQLHAMDIYHNVLSERYAAATPA